MSLKRSPLHAAHLARGGKVVPFAGWEMPVQYANLIAEHEAVRTKCGIFDISHMGQLVVTGAGAGGALNRLLTNDVAKLGDGEGQYTLMLNDDGGVIDDLILYRESETQFFLVANASMIEKDVAWLESHLPGDVKLGNASESWAGLAIQGPQATDIFHRMGLEVDLPPRNGIARVGSYVICRTGYTGEDGFEFFCAAEEGGAWFDRFIEAGAVPCGLGARDSLRLEMGYPLNGSDLTPEHSPVEAGLSFFVSLEKGDFIGRERCLADKAAPRRKLTAIATTAKGPPPRAHYDVCEPHGDKIGELTSGILSPTHRVGIGMAYLPLEYSKPSCEIEIEVRGRRVPAITIKKSQLRNPPAYS